VVLSGAQAEKGLSLRTGCLCSLRNLMLRKSTATGELEGSLGGVEQLVIAVSDDDASCSTLAMPLKALRKCVHQSADPDTYLQMGNTFYSRKVEWLNSSTSSWSIDEVRRHDGNQAKFQIKAQVVSCVPRKLSEFIRRRCKRCGRRCVSL
jgi:hypothetical protein